MMPSLALPTSIVKGHGGVKLGRLRTVPPLNMLGPWALRFRGKDTQNDGKAYCPY
jgi:hypothetical protein